MKQKDLQWEMNTVNNNNIRLELIENVSMQAKRKDTLQSAAFEEEVFHAIPFQLTGVLNTVDAFHIGYSCHFFDECHKKINPLKPLVGVVIVCYVSVRKMYNPHSYLK